MFNILLAETRPSGAFNEDIAGYTSTAAWVIDGASGVGENLIPAPSDAHWFARHVDTELRNLLTREPMMPFENLFAEVIARCATTYATLARRPAAGRHELPSAAIAFMRILSDRIELATLGDCQILYASQSGGLVAEHGNGGHIGPFEERTKAAARAIVARNPDISATALFEELRPHLTQNRASMNVEGGYWVLGLQLAAIEHADRIELPLGNWEFALASDGFLRLSDLFGRLERSALLSIKHADLFEHWYADLRQFEHAHNSLADYPRAKVADDATFVRIEVRTNTSSI
jgi:hypothetical protein